MDWDEGGKCFRFAASVMRQRSSLPLPLNENERLIIDTLWDSPLLTFRELLERTGLAYTTLRDRLKALQTPAKGQWVVKVAPAGEPPLYMVEIGRERPWGVSGVG
jgi:hypothetical protein